MNQFKRAALTVMFAVCLSKCAAVPVTVAFRQTPLLPAGNSVETVDETGSENE